MDTGNGVAASFLSAVEAAPNAVALASPSEELSYLSLLEHSQGVAAAISELGVGPEERVGIACQRGFGRVIGIVGTLLAGAAYVPIDSKQPRARMAEIIGDADIKVVLRDESGTDFEGLTPSLPLDRRRGSTPHPGPRPPADLNRLAYIIFTSGSSGRPKGVEITDRGVLALVAAVDDLAGRHHVNRILQFAAHTFDASVWEIFPALLTGRSLWFPAEEPSNVLPERLINEAVAEGVEMATLPPSYVMAADPDAIRTMPAVTVVAGEPCPPALVRRWVSHTALYNAYGPTEITVAATIARCEEADVLEVPIGHPLSHIDIEILADGSPVAGEAVGELFLGGPSLARGYLGDEKLTAERFRKIETDAGRRRMYATGDLVRRRADGQLVFVERADRQVKLRGHRVELGDVEAALLSAPGVEQAVAVATGENGLLERLVGFISGSGVDPASVRAEVARIRPAYMVPGEIRVVDTWPAGSTGKIDHAALRDSLVKPTAQTPTDAAADINASLSRHWRDLLDVEAVDVDSNFFDLGGHSILVIRLVSRVREDLGIQLTTRDLYENPRFGDFCEAVELAPRSAPA